MEAWTEQMRGLGYAGLFRMGVSHWEVDGKCMTHAIVVVAYDLLLCLLLFLIICLGMSFFQVEGTLPSLKAGFSFCFGRDSMRLTVLPRVAMVIPGHNCIASIQYSSVRINNWLREMYVQLHLSRWNIHSLRKRQPLGIWSGSSSNPLKRGVEAGLFGLINQNLDAGWLSSSCHVLV